MDNEVMELIDTLYSMVSEAWGVPLGNDKCIVERDKVLSMIEEIKSRIPEELAEAKRLVSARDEFIGNDFEEADAFMRAKAAEMESAAAARSGALRQSALEFIDDALRRAEESAGTALNELHTSRARFRGTAGVNEALHAVRQPQAEPTEQE